MLIVYQTIAHWNVESSLFCYWTDWVIHPNIPKLQDKTIFALQGQDRIGLGWF